MHCVENGFAGVGRKNCQVVGADHNLKLDPNGLFKVAAPVWIFRDLCTALEREQRQRRQHECTNAGRFGRTPASTQMEQSVRKMQSEVASAHIFDDSGRREWRLIMLHWVLPPDGGPQDVRHLLRRLSPRGQVIILICLLPVRQVLCSAASDHLCGFIISAGAR